MRIRKSQLDELSAQTKRERRAELTRRLGADESAAHVDPDNGVVVFRDARGYSSTVELSDQGLLALRTATGREYRLSRDEAGRVTSFEAANHLRYDITYRDGALSEVARDAQALVRLNYKPEDGLVKASFPDGNIESLRYDPSGQQLLSTVDGLGNETQFVRDAAGQVVEVRDARGHSTMFEYDEDGQPAATSFADGTSERYKVDEEGLQISLGDRVFTRVVLGDDAGLEAVRFADDVRLRFRFENGSPVAASNEAHELEFAYNEAGQIVREELDGEAVEFAYDQDGNLETLKGAAGDLRFKHDGDDLLTSVAVWDVGEIKIDYARSGQISRIDFPNSVTTVVDASPAGRIDAITTAQRAGAGPPAVNDEYWYDVRDRVERRRRNSQDTVFRYDRAGRLTETLSESAGRQSGRSIREQFAYDATGNRTRFGGSVSAFDVMNRVVRSGDVSFRHDEFGNLISRTDGRDRGATYRYNGQGLLVEAIDGHGRSVRFTYDAFGRRVSKRDGQNITRYSWAGRQLLRERLTREGLTVERRDYLYYPGQHLPLAVRINDRCYFYHTDRSGTVLALTDSDGEMVWQADYSAFGEVTIRIEYVSQPLRLLGHYHDSETGLYYNLFRYYDPTLGRYITPDPIRYESGSTNFYQYADNDPINRSDPEGHIVIPAALLIIAGAALVGGLIGGAISAAQGDGFWKGAAAGAVAGAIGAAVPIIAAAAGLGGAALVAVALAGDAVAGGVQSCMEGGASLKNFATGAGIAVATTIATFGLARIPGVRKALGAVGKRLGRVADKVVGKAKQVFYRAFPGRKAAARTARKAAQKAAKPPALLKKGLRRQGREKSPPGGFKQEWSEGGYDYEVRVHPADPKYGKSGNIYRVARRQQGKNAKGQGKGWEYVDKDGNWHSEKTLKPGKPGQPPNPTFNSKAAKDTHMAVPKEMLP